MSTRNWIETGASLLGGAGLGAAVMYLFDPELGVKRRAQAMEAAEEALSSTGEQLGSAWETVSGKAQDVGQQLSRSAGKWTAQASRALSQAGSTAEDYAGEAADQARSYGRGAAKASRGYMTSARRQASHWLSPESEGSGTTAAGIVIGTAGALILGAGLMYLLDPAQGRRRRAYLRDKAIHAARQTSHYMESQSRHLGNKAQGMVAKARQVAETAKEKITGESQQTTEAGRGQ